MSIGQNHATVWMTVHKGEGLSTAGEHWVSQRGSQKNDTSRGGAVDALGGNSLPFKNT